MRLRPDGSVQSGATPTFQNTVERENNQLYRGMVIEVKYVDDTNNITQNAKNPEVLYDVVVLGGPQAGQVISNCRLSSDFGGNLNYYERVLKATTKKLNVDPLVNHDGDIVFVQFTQGHSGYPVITCCDGGTDTVGKIGASKSDGPRLRRQYNGVLEEINKDGEYIFLKKGGSFSDPEFVPNSEELYKKVVSKDEKVTETFKSGLTIEKDGAGDKVTMTTAGGAVIEVDGASGKITLTKDATVIELDGNSGKISLKGELIDLGASVTDFVTKFNELATAFNAHTHQVPVTGGSSSGVYPSQPPAGPLLSIVGSQTVKVQD